MFLAKMFLAEINFRAGAITIENSVANGCRYITCMLWKQYLRIQILKHFFMFVNIFVDSQNI